MVLFCTLGQIQAPHLFLGTKELHYCAMAVPIYTSTRWLHLGRYLNLPSIYVCFSANNFKLMTNKWDEISGDQGLMLLNFFAKTDTADNWV